MPSPATDPFPGYSKHTAHDTAAADAANRAALEELQHRRTAAEQQLDARAAAHRDEWVAELVRRTLAQPRAGGEA